MVPKQCNAMIKCCQQNGTVLHVEQLHENSSVYESFRLEQVMIPKKYGRSGSGGAFVILNWAKVHTKPILAMTQLNGKRLRNNKLLCWIDIASATGWSERLQAANRDKHSPMMMLFPEGTTTNGDFLLPFKTGAFLAKTPVMPVILRYQYERFSPAWDTISGVRHVLLLLCQFVNYLEVTRLPVYCPSEKEKADPKLYANNVRKLMALEGNLTMSDIGLPEKRIYHAALHGDSW